MDAKQLWNRYCKHFLTVSDLDISLDISRMRFDEGYLSSMKEAMTRAFSAMSALEQGAIANPDENRMVGHYWLRTPELAPVELQEKIRSTVFDIKSFAKEVHDGKLKPEKSARFTTVLLLGIGGSALGPQLVRDALWTPNDKMRLFFCDNTDPDGINRTLLEIGSSLNSTLALVVSKSGGTVETANAALEVSRIFKEQGLAFAKHAVAITCPGSKLDKQADTEGWLRRIEMWDWVGGRTSIFSSVGLVPAALQGIDIDEFLSGGNAMDRATRNPVTAENPAALLALMWHFAGSGKGAKDMVVLPYKDRLVLMSKYLQQLVMESLGKERDLDGKVVNQGIAVYGNKGSTDQHAYVQQLRDGLNNFFATFIEVSNDFFPGVSHPKPLLVKENVTSGDYLQGFMLGTRRALYENNRDSVTITLRELNARTLGALIALFDRTVGLYASLINVNAYHQPGVEAGKKAAERVVGLQQKLLSTLGGSGREVTSLDAASAIGEADEVETVFKILEHLSANSGRGVTKSGSGAPDKIKFKF